MQDRELLQEFVKNDSQSAFGQVVERHLNFVYSTCLRELGDSTLAEDATQVVFLLLSQKASTLRSGTVLTGWLFQTARFVSKNAWKQEIRRCQRTQKAAEEIMHQARTHSPIEEDTWTQIQPLLHDAMNGLSAADRNAVLIRCFEGRSLKETGEALGVTEDAARKRVARALEKLRRYFSRHGVTLSTITLTTLLSSQAVQAAPVGLSAVMSSLFPTTVVAGSVTGGALGSGALGSGAVTGSTWSAKTIALSQSVQHAWLLANIKVAAKVVCCLALVAVGTGQLIRHTGNGQPHPATVAPLAKRPPVPTAARKTIRIVSVAPPLIKQQEKPPLKQALKQALKQGATTLPAPKVLTPLRPAPVLEDSASAPSQTPTQRDPRRLQAKPIAHKPVIHPKPLTTSAPGTAQERGPEGAHNPEVPPAIAPKVIASEQVSTRDQTPLPRDNNRREDMQIKKTVVSALAGAAIVGSALAPQQVVAAEGDKGTITGLLITKGDTWVEVRGDDAKEAKRFGPRWIGGLPKDGGGFDKTVLEAFKKIPAPNRVKLDWVTAEGVRVTNIELIAPTEKSGVVEGTVTGLGDRWVEVKAGDKPAERYSPRWTEGGPDKETLRALGELKVGDKVRLEWNYNERLRIVSVKKAD